MKSNSFPIEALYIWPLVVLTSGNHRLTFGTVCSINSTGRVSMLSISHCVWILPRCEVYWPRLASCLLFCPSCIWFIWQCLPLDVFHSSQWLRVCVLLANVPFCPCRDVAGCACERPISCRIILFTMCACVFLAVSQSMSESHLLGRRSPVGRVSLVFNG